MDVTLRPLTRDDLILLGAWLREPVVQEWWHEDDAPEALEHRYGAAIDGRDPTALRIGLVDGAPAGFVQWYRLADEPEYVAELAPFVPIPADAWSLDYLVGDAALRRRGVGTAFVRAALAEIGAAPVVVPVHARNPGSAGVLRGAGFRLAAEAQLEPDNPAHSRDHLVFVRAALSA
ncbi:GNAT family N-acetyltransferase [uncultured Amnibacterium sp.]|uniref:GNAT family N-acetyltransferase n=1 Tax=uncultured Amnibacterium sp. TaxID=1631851 RepID=UPI0035CB95B1